MFCRECGAEIKENGRFCPACGTEVRLVRKTEPVKEEVTVKKETTSSSRENTVQQTAQQTVADTDNRNMDEVMSVWSYVILFIIGAIPIIGIIVIIVFAINSSNKNKTNYCRAIIVLWLIGVVLMLLFGASVFGIMRSL